MNYQKKFLIINLVWITFAHNNLFGMYQPQPTMQQQPIQIHINTASSWFSFKNILLGSVVIAGFALYYKFRGHAFNEIKNEIKQGTKKVQGNLEILNKKTNQQLQQTKEIASDVNDTFEITNEIHDNTVTIQQQNEHTHSEIDLLKNQITYLTQQLKKLTELIVPATSNILPSRTLAQNISYAQQTGLTPILGRR